MSALGFGNSLKASKQSDVSNNFMDFRLLKMGCDFADNDFLLLIYGNTEYDFSKS